MSEQPGGTLPGGPDFPPNEAPPNRTPSDGWQQPYDGPYGPGAGYPTPPPAGPVPPVDKGFLGSLFDYGFTSYVTPKLIKVIYILLSVIIPIVWLIYVVGAFGVGPGLGLVVLILGGIVALIALAMYRVALELIMIVFHIGYDVNQIARRQH